MTRFDWRSSPAVVWLLQVRFGWSRAPYLGSPSRRAMRSHIDDTSRKENETRRIHLASIISALLLPPLFGSAPALSGPSTTDIDFDQDSSGTEISVESDHMSDCGFAFCTVSGTEHVFNPGPVEGRPERIEFSLVGALGLPFKGTIGRGVNTTSLKNSWSVQTFLAAIVLGTSRTIALEDQRANEEDRVPDLTRSYASHKVLGLSGTVNLSAGVTGVRIGGSLTASEVESTPLVDFESFVERDLSGEDLYTYTITNNLLSPITFVWESAAISGTVGANDVFTTTRRSLKPSRQIVGSATFFDQGGDLIVIQAPAARPARPDDPPVTAPEKPDPSLELLLTRLRFPL